MQETFPQDIEQPILPEFLYHYTSHDGLYGIITSRKIWATKIQYLNDSREFTYAIDIVKDLLHQIPLLDKYPAAKFYNACKFLSENIERVENLNICVFSLSEEPDLLSQWRAYCYPEGGYSLGFYIPDLIRLIQKNHFYIAPCIYDTQEHKNLIANITLPYIEKVIQEKSKKDIDKEELEKIHHEFSMRVTKVSPLIKHHSFHEEKEWRIVSYYAIRSDNTDYKLRQHTNMLVPYYELSLENNEIKFPLREVIVGPNKYQDLAMNSITDLLSKENINKWSTTKSIIPFRNI